MALQNLKESKAMRLKLIYMMVAFGCAAALVGCSDGEFAGVSETGFAPETVAVTLTASRPSGAHTRTLLQENTAGGLNSTWSAGDKLLVVASDGIKAGELTLQTGANSTEGVFSGELQITDGTKARVWYLGANNGDDAPYTSAAVSSNGKVTALTTDLRTNFGGKFDDLKRADLLTKEDVVFTVKDGKGYVRNERVELSAMMAMAHFTLKFPDDFVSSGEATLTVNSEDDDLPSKKVWNPLTTGDSTPSEGYSLTLGSEASGIVLQNNRADVYLPIVPGSYKLKFDVVAGGKQYTYSLKDKSTIEGGYYYTSGESSESSSTFDGILVSLVEVSQPAKEDEDLVGSVFEVNGKRFRFTKANLKYIVDSGDWVLMERQYSFICKGGWTLSNGSWAKGKETEIDLFGFGATGLYDVESGETAQAPTFWRQTAQQTYSIAAYYYPTNNTTTNQGAGFLGSYLEHGTQFTNFDWGKAYYLNKNKEAYPTQEKPYTSYDWAIDPTFDESKDSKALRYFTLSSSDWTQLQAKYFMTGATITGIGNSVNSDAKGNIFGCLIIKVEGTNSEKLAKVKDFLTGKVTYISPSLSANLSYTGTNYQYFKYNYVQMTGAQFDALEKLGVVFLPEAGHRAPDAYTKTDAYYWTSTTGQQYVSTFFRFDGNSSPSVFKLDPINRSMGGSVRLVKEVPADYVDPMVVE